MYPEFTMRIQVSEHFYSDHVSNRDAYVEQDFEIQYNDWYGDPVDGKGGIGISITGSDGQTGSEPLRGATVKVYETGTSNLVAQQQTETSHVHFLDIDPGVYDVIANVNGYDSGRSSLQVDDGVTTNRQLWIQLPNMEYLHTNNMEYAVPDFLVWFVDTHYTGVEGSTLRFYEVQGGGEVYVGEVQTDQYGFAAFRGVEYGKTYRVEYTVPEGYSTTDVIEWWNTFSNGNEFRFDYTGNSHLMLMTNQLTDYRY